MSSELPGRTHKLSATPLAVFALSLLLSVAAAALIATMARERDAARFDYVVEAARDRVESRLEAHLALLRAGAAFVAASEVVTVDEFEAFVNRNRLGELFPGIQGFGYSVPITGPGVRDSVIAAQRASGFPDFRIWPDTAPGEEVHAIVYLFPLDVRNRAAIGFNMFSEATRREAMVRARDSGRTSMTGKVTLVQEIDGPTQPGFLIYSPVFTTVEMPPSTAERRISFQGFVYAPFRAGDFFRAIFDPSADPYVAFRVYDGIAADSAALLHDSAAQGIEPSGSPRFTHVATLGLGGRSWTITFASTEAFEAEQFRHTWLIMLVLGIAGSTVIFLVMRREVAERAHAESLTFQLQEASGELERQIAEVRHLAHEVETKNTDLESINQALLESNQKLVDLRLEADAARAEADQANAAKSEFLAAMSHELRTPLNAIMGYADLLEMGIHGPVNDAQKHALERIRRSQVHLLSLITDILNFAKIEAGRLEVRVEEVPVATLLTDVQSMTEPQAVEKGVALSFDAVPHDVVALGDPDKIRQILLNLLTNAIKFTPAGGSVRLSVEPSADRVLLRVVDTGPGIPADRLASVFDPFVQIDRHGGQDGQHGVGLGLAISRDLAQLMMGSLSARSVVGRGSEFSLDLPAGHQPPHGDRARG